MEFKKGKKVRVLSHGHDKEYIGLEGVITSFDDGLYDFNVEFESVPNNKSTEELFYKSELKPLTDKPERYKSREVHGMDVIALAEHWKLNFQEGNILKYLLRDKGEDESDMQKIADYANRELELIKQRKG